MEGAGNDLFLHWSVDCLNHEHKGGEYRFVNGTNVHESSRADSCMQRFDTSSFSKFFVTNRKIGLPGKELYYSSMLLFICYYFFVIIYLCEQKYFFYKQWNNSM